ncbi:MAG: penicillin acylase family protein, partial [Ignavibacteriales bacterium]|nr:penicillin acylase family protein [Ignavibacteriales bacterium]
MRPRTRILIGLGFTVLAVGVAGLILAYFLATRSFPQTKGTLDIAGLEKAVRVYRDVFGVPHIIAETDHDAFVAAGFVQAQDRFWQMEFIRRAGMGRLAEVLGLPALRTDRLFRTLGLARLADEIVQTLDLETRSALEAYARGVNAYIAEHKGKYPVEFDILGYEPEPWTVQNTILLGKLMAWELNYSRWIDITYGYIVERLGEQPARELYPDWPEDGPIIVPEELRGKRIAYLGKQLLEADQEFRSLLGDAAFGSGSNSWVISASRSVTGRPVLANDPHLILAAPARWYEMHLVAPGFDVIGASLAGNPFIIIGRNRRIAWGITAAMIDDQDFYVEEADSVEHPTRYRFKNQWLPIEQHVDTILIKNDLPVILTSYRTHRGPVVNRIEPAAELSRHLLSMRWVAHEISNEARTFMLLNRAGSWNEFREALKSFAAPSQNFVYADVDGNIGYITVGKIPNRPVEGFASPYPGWTDQYDWNGFVPFDEHPQVFNPADGFIATANNRIAPSSYPKYLSHQWEPAWRATRIVEVLRHNEKMTLEDHQRLQLDLLSPHARILVPTILAAFDGIEIQDPDMRSALNYFRNWNFIMRGEDVTTSLFQAFLVKAIRNTFADELGPSVARLYDTLATKPLTALTELLQMDSSVWFDDVT